MRHVDLIVGGVIVGCVLVCVVGFAAVGFDHMLHLDLSGLAK